MQEKYGVINSWKGISAVIIACFFHLKQAGFVDGKELAFMEDNLFFSFLYAYGGYFVEFFFVLSGFIFWMHYAPGIRAGNYRFHDYWKRRIIRIFPLMISSLVITAILQEIYRIQFDHYWLWCSDNTLFTFVLNCFGLQDLFSFSYSFNCPAWTLTIFFVLWILFYIVVYVSKGNTNVEMYWCAAFIIIGLSILLSYPDSKLPFLKYNFGRGYVGFFIGGGLQLVYSNISEKQKKLAGYSSLLLLLGILSAAYKLHISLEPVNIVMECIIFPLLLIASLEVIVFRKFLSLRLFKVAGNISFSLYLFNFSCQALLALLMENGILKTDCNSIIFFIIHFIANIVVAVFFWLLIERRSDGIYRKICTGRGEK